MCWRMLGCVLYQWLMLPNISQLQAVLAGDKMAPVINLSYQPSPASQPSQGSQTHGSTQVSSINNKKYLCPSLLVPRPRQRTDNKLHRGACTLLARGQFRCTGVNRERVNVTNKRFFYSATWLPATDLQYPRAQIPHKKCVSAQIAIAHDVWLRESCHWLPW